MTGTERDDRARHLAGEYPVACIRGHVVAQRPAVSEVRHIVAAFARRHRADEELCARIALAVTEAVANVVVHAYAREGRRRGLVHYAVDIADGDLELVVVDDGDGIREDAESDGAGLGLRMIAELADDFTIRTRRPGLEVWMRFAVD